MQFPTVLANLAKNLAWTSSLGQAYEYHGSDLMAAVQLMRAKAQAAGTLQSNAHITVTQPSSGVIVIQPANPQVVYVPQYNPTIVYGQRIISTSGKQDGLYWPASKTQNASPLGDLSQLPKSSLSSYSGDQPLVVDDYSLRILTSQGPDAPGGAMNYIVDGKMIGVSILATPVKYGETGIMTIMISQEGMVYERDFGPDTLKLAGAIQDYNPDDNWSEVE
jgi:Protein of unknown function (DUF2950)/Protein of unknown function (DUF3300)